MPNGPQAALAIVAVACSAVTIPLNPKQTVREIEVCLAALKPDAILLMKNCNSVARQVAERQGLTIIEAVPSKEGILGFSIVALQSGVTSTHGEPDEPDPSAPAFILQTSGTAAEPKLIPLSHRNMLAAAARLQAWFHLTPQDRCLSVSPPFYSHGLKVTVFTPLLTGGTVVFPTDASKFDYAEWFLVSEAHLVFGWSNAPSLNLRSNTEFEADAPAGHSLRFILSGGAPLPPKRSSGLQELARRSCGRTLWLQRRRADRCKSATAGSLKAGYMRYPWPRHDDDRRRGRRLSARASG